MVAPVSCVVDWRADVGCPVSIRVHCGGNRDADRGSVTAWVKSLCAGFRCAACRGYRCHWCDRYGPQKPLWYGVLVFVAGLLIAGLAPTMALLVVGRAMQGFGAGVLYVALYVIVGRVY